MQYNITDENNIPQELLDAVQQDKVIQCLTTIGWISVDSPEFRVGNTYKIKEEGK